MLESPLGSSAEEEMTVRHRGGVATFIDGIDRARRGDGQYNASPNPSRSLRQTFEGRIGCASTYNTNANCVPATTWC